MSIKNPASLAERRHDFTRKLIIDTAVDALERMPVSELTVRSVARDANISERTVFRYFASREAFLDAVADEVRLRLDLPPPPSTRSDLDVAARRLYEAFEARGNLTRAALHTELFPRMRETQAKARWNAVRELIDRIAPLQSEQARRIAAANIRFHLAASAWHYYRVHFGFSLEDSIACAETAIRQAIDGLR